MTVEQEDALYNFLEQRAEPFTLKEAAMSARSKDFRKFGRLKGEIAEIFINRHIVFPVGENKWISRYGCFAKSQFVITPTRLELLNGILIAGHRCIPFANPFVMPQDYKFFWHGNEIKVTDSEGAPDEFYPFFSIFGEEYAPQYIARDNPENELAFDEESGEDPDEVSLKTFDMRQVYRESLFVPGDRFLVRIKDWKMASFELERVAKDAWTQIDLEEWQKIAESAFLESFEEIGPGIATEEQIAWAFFKGGPRMRNVPAYSLEDFLYEKTDKIDVTAFGLESRFWYAGKEIPDYKRMEGIRTQIDETPIERVLLMHNIPISEFVVQAYVRDALFRNDTDLTHIVERIVPSSAGMSNWDRDFIAAYVANEIEETAKYYSVFTDQKTGPIRQQAAELHSAVINLALRLGKGEIDLSLLPKHAFIVLSQIQIYSSGILEDIDTDVVPTEVELNAIDNSMENMIDIFDEMKEMIDLSRDNFRRNNISLVQKDENAKETWRTVQISIGGTDIWRRLLIPSSYKLIDLQKIILAVFKWTGFLDHCWVFEYSSDLDLQNENQNLLETKTLEELASHCIKEFTYEYGSHWTVKIILSPCNEANIEKVVCVAGACASPPEKVEGPLRLRRFVSALEKNNNDKEKAAAHAELGEGFDPAAFSVDDCNKDVSIAVKKIEGGFVKMFRIENGHRN
jgi:hypothetical protein